MGGWATSKRTQEEFRPCVFGSEDQIESMWHYLQCNNLLHYMAVNSTFTPYVDAISSLGIMPVDKIQMLATVVLYLVYHEINHEIKNEINNDITNENQYSYQP